MKHLNARLLYACALLVTLSACAGNSSQTDAPVNAPNAGALNIRGAVSVSAIPEPSTYALMATGLVGILGFARRRRTQE